jgi:arylsulfatase A-like enzyme
MDTITILLFGVLLWFLMELIKWPGFFDRRMGKFIKAVALILVLCMLPLNTIITVSRYNFRKKPNIILISIETLRADHLSSYGYEKRTAPNIDNFANNSLFFENAYSQWPVTVPALNSIMTGTMLSNEKQRDIRSFFCNATYLAEILADNGYSTAGFTDHIIVGKERGFVNAWYVVQKGFDTFMNIGNDSSTVNSDILTRMITNWLQRNYKNKFFLWVHYFDPHHDFVPLPEYEGLFGFSEEDCGRIHNPMEMHEIVDIQETLTDKEIECVMSLYDSEIFYVDNNLGGLFDKLTGLNLWENTVVIITSDHGEEFMERERIGHGTTIYNETIRVPLMIRIPGRQPAKIKGNIATMDLFNIICDLTSNKEVEFNDKDVISRSNPSGREKKANLNDFAIISGDYKFIYNPETGSEELFNLRSDVAEKNNLLTDTEYKAKKVELKGKLLSWISENDVEVEPISEDTLENERRLRERLRSLGYIK